MKEEPASDRSGDAEGTPRPPAAPQETLREAWVGGVAGGAPAAPQETLREAWVGGVAVPAAREASPNPARRGAAETQPDAGTGDIANPAAMATQREHWVGGVSPPPAPAAHAGEAFGRYRLLRELGRGAMGIVHQAWDTELKRYVALKTLLLRAPALPAGAPAPALPADDSEVVQRFHREARAAARLRHPNVVQVHDVGSYAGRHYFTMDFIEGESLEEAFPRLDLRRRVEVLRDVARALHAAHEAGVVHRDVKPANILLDRTGRPHVSDFGLAKAAQEAAHRKLTMDGAVMGTPYYMSPEQAEGLHDRVGPRSDQWSAGVILYRALAGGFPFDDPTVVVLLSRILAEDPVPPTRAAARRTGLPTVPPDLETICLKCLEKEPARRFDSMATLADELERWLTGEPIRCRRSGWFERAGRQARRHRSTTAALALLALLVPALAISFAFLHTRSDELARETQAAEARRRAEPECLAGQKRFEEALAIWKAQVLRWLTVGSKHRTLDQFLAEPGFLERVAERNERIAQARAAFGRALEADPGYALALAARAELELGVGDPRAALADANRAVTLEPACAPARAARALAALRVHELERGAPYRLEFVAPEETGTGGAARGSVRIRKQEPESAAERGLRERAAADLAALRRDATAPAAGATAQAALWYSEGKTNEAGEAVESALTLAPSDPSAQFWAGRICAATGDAERARRYLTAFLVLHPDDASTRCAYGGFLALEGELPDAAAQFAKATAGLPELFRAWIDHAGACTALGRHDQAVRDLEAAARLRPDDPSVPLLLTEANRRWASQGGPERPR